MDEILYVDSGEEAIKEYITKHFRLLLPFEVSQGFSFQVRISEKQYEKLSDKIKGELCFWAEREINDVYERGSEAEKRWLEDHYWTNCKAYIFNHISERSYVLEARCEYGYDGMEESYSILFFEKTDFAPIICKNMNTTERKEDFDDGFPTEL